MSRKFAASLVLLIMLFSIVACAPANAGDVAQTGKESQEETTVETAASIEWSPESDCSMCHDKESSSFTNAECLTSKHATLDCVTCHTDTTTLGTVHANTSSEGASSLSATTVDTAAICQSCHDVEELKIATADSIVLTDANGNVANPHDLPVSDDHATVTCVDCHKMHSTTNLQKSADRMCSTCHHTDVYECGTCHAV
ncbi:MAG: hypothetical protein HGA54_00470 [Actinobacteria bacterium]|nr:hypothetical protein [Actinomycetota bacterium]